MSEDGSPTSDLNRPIWQSPAWLTALSGVVCSFLTVPSVVGDYLSKKQDIELAKQEVARIEVSTSNEKQNLEFAIVNNTLAQQGSERVFVLRYLARTLDDDDARAWANEEVERLEELVRAESALSAATASELSIGRVAPQSDGVDISDEITLQIEEIAKLRRDVERLRATAGIASSDGGRWPVEARIDASCVEGSSYGDLEVTSLDAMPGVIFYQVKLKEIDRIPPGCALVPVLYESTGVGWLQHRNNGWIERVPEDRSDGMAVLSVSKSSAFPLHITYHLLDINRAQQAISASYDGVSALLNDLPVGGVGNRCQLLRAAPFVKCDQR